jgi:hypothetical protein
MVIQHDVPSERPEEHIVTEYQIGSYDRGSFMLYRPEWVFGKPQFQLITAGRNKGKFFQSRRFNFAPISLSLGGERLDGELHRLGGGSFSRHADWLRSADQTIQPTPPDVKSVYDSLIRRIDIGKRLRGGIHNYMVLAHAWEKLVSGLELPPFDYIERPRHIPT